MLQPDVMRVDLYVAVPPVSATISGQTVQAAAPRCANQRQERRMAQTGKAAPEGVAFPAGDSSGLLPITRSMTAQALPVHCGHAPSRHALENRNRLAHLPLMLPGKFCVSNDEPELIPCHRKLLFSCLLGRAGNVPPSLVPPWPTARMITTRAGPQNVPQDRVGYWRRWRRKAAVDREPDRRGFCSCVQSERRGQVQDRSPGAAGREGVAMLAEQLERPPAWRAGLGPARPIAYFAASLAVSGVKQRSGFRSGRVHQAWWSPRGWRKPAPAG